MSSSGNKIMATASKIAAVCGFKTHDMKQFIESMRNVEYEDRTFNDSDGKRVDYRVYEVVRVVMAVEGYTNMISADNAKQIQQAEILAEERLAEIYGGGIQSGEYVEVP